MIKSKVLNIKIQIRSRNKKTMDNLEITFNNEPIKNIVYNFDSNTTLVQFSVNETTEISQSILSIKNVKNNDIVWIKSLYINDFECSNYFGLITDRVPVVIIPQDTVLLKWQSPYSYYFLKFF
jgi:hypothetical protein